MSHIYHQVRADCSCDGSELREVDNSGICGRACYDELRLALVRLLVKFLVINEALVVCAVGYEVVELAGNVDRRAVGQVTAVCKAHAHYGVAGLEQSDVNRCVSLCAGVRLNVCELCAEKLLCTLDGDVLYDINVLAAAVVALSGIALSVLVGKHAAHSSHYCRRNYVLAGDKLKISLLALQLQVHRVGNFAVVLSEEADGIYNVTVHFEKCSFQKPLS